MKLIRFVCGASILAVAAHSQTALAQDSEGAAEPAQAEPIIIVTGSRLNRPAEESAVPLQVLTAEEIEETGTGDLYESLEMLPGVSAGVSPEGSVSSIQTSGLSTISLRRLGDNRTLTLINGRRAVSNSGNSDRVSLSTIPSGFVKRTEITTGGASAVYGSDAIAGVVNVILKDDVDGIELDGRYSTPEASGGEEYRLEGLWGTSFASDRGYIMLGASYRDENAIFADSSRPKSIAALEFDDPASGSDAFTGETCNNDDPDFFCLLPSLSGSTPGGVFEGGDAWFKDGQWFNDKSLRPDDRPEGSDFFSDFDGFNVRPGRSLRPERQILTLGLHSTYDLGDTTTVTFSGQYSKVDSYYVTGYETLNDDDEFGIDADGNINIFEVGNISRNNPFIPDEVEETRSGSVSFDRRLVELGLNARDNERETYRFALDFATDINDTLEWNFYSTYGRFLQEQRNPNEVNFQKAQFALDVEEDGNGGYQCVSAEARADGCVPLNLFGEGSISAEAADYIRYNGFAEQSRDQATFGWLLRSNTIDIGSMGFRWVAGVEFRYEEQDTIGDPDGEVGGIDGDPTTNDRFVTSLSTFPSLEADYSVFEGFAEADLEIIPDQLNLQFAGRVASYSTVGTIFSYNAGVRWNVLDDLGLRAQYSRSQRAPNITEFFSAPRPDSDDLADPCSGLLPDGSGLSAPRSVGGEAVDLSVVAANCLADPGIQAFFADPDYTEGDPFDPSGSVFGPNAGNQNLKEETADTITAGIVYQPDWMDRNLSLIVDYYRIDISDVISSVTTQNTVDLCYASDSFPNNKFCNVITRNRSNGEISQVINRLENLNNELVEGIDVSFKWKKIDLSFVPGKFDIDVRYSHYFKDQETFEDLNGNLITNNFLPFIDNSADELRLKFGYRLDDFRFTWTVQYEDGGVDDPVNFPNPGDLEYFELDSEWFHRIYASYEFGNDDQFRVYGGVNNLFDTIGPIYPTGTLGGSSYNIRSNLNDSVGREFYVGVKAKF